MFPCIQHARRMVRFTQWQGYAKQHSNLHLTAVAAFVPSTNSWQSVTCISNAFSIGKGSVRGLADNAGERSKREQARQKQRQELEHEREKQRMARDQARERLQLEREMQRKEREEARERERKEREEARERHREEMRGRFRAKSRIEAEQRFEEINEDKRNSGGVVSAKSIAQQSRTASLKYVGGFLGLGTGTAFAGELLAPGSGIGMLAFSAIATRAFFELSVILCSSSGGARVAEMMGGYLVDGNSPEFSNALQSLHKICDAGEIPHSRLYVIDSQELNAFAAGLSQSHATVTVTRGLVALLEEEELEAVLAHEVGHIINQDMKTDTVLYSLLAGFWGLARVGRRMKLKGQRSRDSKGIDPALALQIVGIASGCLGFLLQRAISREREFAADAASVALVGTSALASALRKMEQAQHYTGPLSEPANVAMVGHAYIVSAARSSSSSGDSLEIADTSFWNRILNLASTHPPSRDRIEAIEKAAQALASARQARSEDDRFQQPRFS